MSGKIDHYLDLFKKLRTDKNRTRWDPVTLNCAPHKPFLLLAVLDHISMGLIKSNFITPDYELVETFSRYWSKIMPLGSKGNMAYPFFHMDSEPFWHLSPRPGVHIPAGRGIYSIKRIRELFLGASLDEELFPFLMMDHLRDKLRETLITNYFAKEIQPVLRVQGDINREAFEYSEKLLQISEAAPDAFSSDNGDEKKRTVRDQGFRRAIVTLYEHRCALCGIRMMTPIGHTVVEAAHIEPWNLNHDDRPNNGMALCRLCHWSFDEGLMTVNKDYEVKVSKTVRQDNNFPGHILTLSDRPIFKPGQAKFWPAQDNLDYHRKKIFIK